MQNTNKIKRTIACSAVGVLALAFVVTSISSSSYLPSRLLIAQENTTFDTFSGESYPTTNIQEYPSSTGGGENFDDYNKPDPSYDSDGNYQYDEYKDDYSNQEYPDNNWDSTSPDGNWDNGDYNNQQNYEGDMHGTSTTDGDWNNDYNDNYNDNWQEENDNYKEWDQQNEEKQQYDTEEFGRKIEQLKREIQNRSRDLQRIKREAGDNQQTQQLVLQIESQIQKIENCANSANASDDPVGVCWDLFEDLNPLFEKANMASEAKHFERELRDLERNEREFTKMERDGIDVSGLRTKLAKIKSLIEQMATATDSDTREDLRWEKEDLSEDFRSEMNNAFRQREFTQFNEQCDKHVAREVERAKKELSREGTADANLIAKLDGLVQTCKGIVAKALAKVESGGEIDGWEIGDQLREQVWEKLQELTRSFNEKRMCQDITRGLGELEKGVTVEAPGILAKVPANLKPKIETLIAKGKQILADARNALAVDNCEKAGHILKSAEELEWQFRDIMHAAGLDEGLIDYSDNYEDIYDDFADADFNMDKEKFKQLMKEKRFGVDEMDRMQKLSKDVLAEYFDHNLETNDRTLEFATTANLDNSKLQSLIQAKNDLMAEVEDLRAQVSGLKQEIKNITAELSAYNFGIGGAKDEAKALAAKLSTMGEAEAAEEFRKIKAKAITEKVSEGIIGFPDADDTTDNWFAAFALKAKNEGLIKGNADGTLNPGGQLNYSEAAVAFGRVAGLDGQTSNSAVAGKLAGWANEGVAALETKGVNLDFMSRVNAGDSIKREEVAVLLSEVLGLSDVAVSESGFSDLSQADAREKQAIANVNAAGIMTGKGGTDQFGVGENLSRAALTKVLSLATDQNQ